MKEEILSAINKINDMIVEYDDYVLYINEDYYKIHKDELNFIDVKIEITNLLPKNINVVYMKKVNWNYECWLDIRKGSD